MVAAAAHDACHTVACAATEPRLLEATMIWLSRFLFFLTLALAFGLAALVVATPWTEEQEPWLMLFAHDAIVRRTALVSAAGLAVTAMVFFRPKFFRSRKLKSKYPPPGTFAGA